MNNKFKLLITYIILILFTLVIFSFIKLSANIQKYSIFILILNSLSFLILSKKFDIDKKIVTIFLLIILGLLLILNIDKHVFSYAYYYNTIIPEILLPILSLMVYPFLPIFKVMAQFNILSISYFIIPLFIFILIYVSRKILD